MNAEDKVNYLRNWDLWGPYLQGILFLLIIGSNHIDIQPTTNFW